NLYNLFCSLASQSRTSAKARADITALGKRALPLLEARLKAETSAAIQRTLTSMVAKQDGVAWVFRVPTAYEPLPPYSDSEEMKRLVSRLTSSTDQGFVMESAGRDLAAHFFTAAFEQLKAAAASENFNPEIVHEGMGYLRDPRVFG